MTTAAEIIENLNEALAAAGENATITRMVKRSGAQVASTVPLRAFVRPVSADQIVGKITQTEMNVTISPTEIMAGVWPGADENVTASGIDQSIVKVTDKITIRGREREIMVSKPLFYCGELVRCDLVVKG